MAITSANNSKELKHYKSTHFRYAVTYIIITAIVLMFLNIYSSKVSQEIFYNSKATSMIEKCRFAATEISNLEVLNTVTASRAIMDLGDLNVSRLLLTDAAGKTLYDSELETVGAKYSLLPEIVQALGKNDVFTWHYQNGAMWSKAAVPIYARGELIGCVYMLEHDAEQGALIQRLQTNTLTITIILGIVVVAFSIFFSNAFSGRARRIMNSMRIIHSGDYSHKVTIGGNDELTVLGNEFNDLIVRLQESEEKRHNFVSDASHELKTPLASIKLLTDSILQNEMDNETVLEFVEDIGNEADRLTRMSNKLLLLSRVEGQENNDCEIINFGPVVEKVIRMLSANAQELNLNITTDLEEDTTILILVDDLYQIVFNLVENGIKYNVPNGSLHISVKRDGDNAVLSVTDTGMGIPPDSIDHIFERFYRVDKARSRKTGGSGLGLSIVRNIVERNNGQIEVSSKLGEGTEFRVAFPIFDVEET